MNSPRGVKVRKGSSTLRSMRTDAQLGKRPNSYGAESYWKDWGCR